MAYEWWVLFQISMGAFLSWEQRTTRIKELLEDLSIFLLLCSTFNKTSVLASADEFT